MRFLIGSRLACVLLLLCLDLVALALRAAAVATLALLRLPGYSLGWLLGWSLKADEDGESEVESLVAIFGLLLGVGAAMIALMGKPGPTWELAIYAMASLALIGSIIATIRSRSETKPNTRRVSRTTFVVGLWLIFCSVVLAPSVGALAFAGKFTNQATERDWRYSGRKGVDYRHDLELSAEQNEFEITIEVTEPLRPLWTIKAIELWEETPGSGEPPVYRGQQGVPDDPSYDPYKQTYSRSGFRKPDKQYFVSVGLHPRDDISADARSNTLDLLNEKKGILITPTKDQ